MRCAEGNTSMVLAWTSYIACAHCEVHHNKAASCLRIGPVQFMVCLYVTCAGMMKLKNNKFARDMRPVDETCSCMVCQQYTRSYLHHTIKAQGVAAPAILITYHNVAYMQVCVGVGRVASAAGNKTKT